MVHLPDDGDALDCLKWLQMQENPTVAVPHHHEYFLPTFEPVNLGGSDVSTRKSSDNPFVTMRSETIMYAWENATLPEHLKQSWNRLLALTPYLGRSKSLAEFTSTESFDIPEGYNVYNLDPDGDIVFRGIYPQSLIDLQQHFAKGYGRIIPYRLFQYALQVENDQWESPFSSEAATVRLTCSDGDICPSERWRMMDDIRKSLMGYANSNSVFRTLIPLISGHDPGTSAPMSGNHLAIVPLDYVGTSDHADGSLKGIAFVLPSDTEYLLRSRFERLLTGWIEKTKTFGFRASTWQIDLPELKPILSLRWDELYCRSSRVWATASPVALSRTPKKISREALEGTLMKELAKDDLYPNRVEVDSSPFLRGATQARKYHFFRGNRRKYMVHARITFDKPVQGPIMAGCGVHLGTGLFLPIKGAKQ